jgi:hypothetical protein
MLVSLVSYALFYDIKSQRSLIENIGQQQSESYRTDTICIHFLTAYISLATQETVFFSHNLSFNKKSLYETISSDS